MSTVVLGGTYLLGDEIARHDLGGGRSAVCIRQGGDYGVQLDETTFVIWCGGRQTALTALDVAAMGDFGKYGRAWADLLLASWRLPAGAAMDAVRDAMRTIEREARRDLGL